MVVGWEVTHQTDTLLSHRGWSVVLEDGKWPQKVFQRHPGVPILYGSSIHRLLEEPARQEAYQSSKQDHEGHREPGRLGIADGSLDLGCP